MRQTEINLPSVVSKLSELEENQEADFYALLAEKQELSTRDGKPYYRVTFRDAGREVSFPIWSDATLSEPCRHEWVVGEFYKLRAILRESSYGSQLEILKIRPVEPSDTEEGFDPFMCMPTSRFDPQAMYDELLQIIKERIADQELARLVQSIFEENREQLLVLPAAKRNHHAYLGGFLEHVLNVTRTCVQLADKYAELYSEMDPPLSKDLIIAGAALHDIGKLRELETGPAGAEYTAGGSLLGHIVQGRDIIREAAAKSNVDPENVLRLEHIVLSHQRLPEWGSPKAPMFPEALIVHYADDLDAKLQMMVTILAEEPGEGQLTSRRNVLGQHVYRGSKE